MIFKEVSNPKRSITIVIVILLLAISFETFQQMYYIKKFDLDKDVSFYKILKNQSYRWVIWMLLGFLLFYYAKSKNTIKKFGPSQFLKYIAFILLLVAINIVLISTIQMVVNGDFFSLPLFVQDYIPFYIFQKAPIYILGYIAIAIILHFYFAAEKLQFQIQKLSELKDSNLKLYNELKSEINDKTTILNVKIGNKRRIIPVEEIEWIEADDYCVKLHLQTGKTYTMRSSLKMLENKLSTPFLRVHRKAIVNMKMVKELNTKNMPLLILNNEQEIPVSKSNLKSVRDFIA
jgi:hypothetical protein